MRIDSFERLNMPPPIPCAQRVYWLNANRHSRARVAMHNVLARTRKTHIRIPAYDAHLDFAGNVSEAQTRSHLRLLERVHHDQPKGQIVLVLEDCVSFEYSPYWTNTVDDIIQRAPTDWGIIQLAYQCDEPTIHRVHQIITHDQYIHRTPDYVEKHVVFDDSGPYVNWNKWHTSLACAYVVHPRAYTNIRTLANSNRISFDVPTWEALFCHTRTYTYHVPMFTTRVNIDGYAPVRALAFHRHPTEAENETRARRAHLTTLVIAWYMRWARTQNRLR